MSKSPKPQRIRDPLHNLIEFDTGQFEQVLWQILQTRPFQRLRRVRQLGFSEMVFPGATHTRFAHSVGVFHTARLLMDIIKRHITASGGQYQEHQAQVALAAALVHDLGHGMFSHAFEDVGKKLHLTMADHELVSDRLIRDSEVAEIFKDLGSGFANDVADVIKRGRPGSLYDAVVSSQFDADRLDYMQRDRLMTGVQNSGIDFRWLAANLEVGTIQTGADETPLGEIETFVLGPKASYAAETYVLALFQLYPTIYFHKATRAAEKVFSALIVRLVALVREGHGNKVGLPGTHPLIRFAQDSDSLENALALDDTVFLGALPLLVEAADPLIRSCAQRLRDRRLPKCNDLRRKLIASMAPEPPKDAEGREKLKKTLTQPATLIKEELEAWSKKNSNDGPRILVDDAERDPYKRFQESKGPLNQIHIRSDDDRILDMAKSSLVVAALEPFVVLRAYADEDDAEAKKVIDDVTERIIKEEGNGGQ